jgi:hypothetical protein
MLACTWRETSAASDRAGAVSPGSVKSVEAGTAASTGSSAAGDGSGATRVIGPSEAFNSA